MAKVTLEEQANAVENVRTHQLRWTSQQLKALAAAEETLGNLALLRDRIQNLDPEDEDSASIASEELIKILGLALLPNGRVVKL